MRQEHMEQVERWAEYVRTHNDWKTHQKKFIDAQIIIARRAYKKLEKTSDGREKINLIKEIKCQMKK